MLLEAGGRRGGGGGREGHVPGRERSAVCCAAALRWRMQPRSGPPRARAMRRCAAAGTPARRCHTARQGSVDTVVLGGAVRRAAVWPEGSSGGSPSRACDSWHRDLTIHTAELECRALQFRSREPFEAGRRSRHGDTRQGGGGQGWGSGCLGLGGLTAKILGQRHRYFAPRT